MAVEKNEMVKRLPTMRESWVQPLGQEDLLEKGKATHSSVFVGEHHEQRSLVGYSPWITKSQTRLRQLSTYESESEVAQSCLTSLQPRGL